jgi:hypothetical protein
VGECEPMSFGGPSTGRLIRLPLVKPAAKIPKPPVAVVRLEHLGRPRLVARRNRVEELADQPETIHLVIVFAGRE